MARFLLGVVTGVLLLGIALVILFFAVLRVQSAPPKVAQNSVLVMHLRGDIPEKAPIQWPISLSAALPVGGIPQYTMANVWMALKMAAADKRIMAVALEPEGLSTGWAKAEEIRSDIEQFRKSGKPVFAYLRTPRSKDYYVALAADRIYLGPEDPLYLQGLRAEMMYFKGTLDKLGVTVDVEHAGKYKDFGDMFTRTDMSPETREVITSVLNDLFGRLVNGIAAARKKTPDQVRAIIDQGPFTASQALKAGLVDELRFEDQMFGELQARLHSGEPKKVRLETYVKVPPGDAGLHQQSQIALVVASGDIVRGSPEDEGDESSLTSYGFDKVLRRVGEDSDIKGVVLRIDSPGGEVSASDDIWRQLMLLRTKKPMVISMSDVAASGGYYIAMTGDPIVAYPATETGSIGVVFGKPDLKGLYNKIGITKDGVQDGKHADVLSDYTPLSPDEKQMLQQGIDESYRQFVTKVAEARHRPYEAIEPAAEGRVWLGSQAQPRGLVDQLGGLNTAIDLVKKRAGIPAAEQVRIVTFPPQRSLLDLLLHRPEDESLLDSKLRQVFGRVPYHAWIEGGYLRLMPYWMEVR
jgi:protease-4